MEEGPDQNSPITPNSPLKSEELPDEYLGNKKLSDGTTYKVAARKKLKGHDFAVYDPAGTEGLPEGLKATCTKCEDIFKGDSTAMCRIHALTPSDKEKTIKILKKCKRRITDEIHRRLHETNGVKYHWNLKHSDKDFPLPDDVSKWENPTANELVSGTFASTANLGFTKERMIKLGFDTEIEWNHLNAIWYLNSRRGKCLDAIQKIKPCGLNTRPTKSAQFGKPMTVPTNTMVTQEEVAREKMATREKLQEQLSKQAEDTRKKNTLMNPTKTAISKKDARKAAKASRKAAKATAAAAQKTASVATTTRKRSKSTKPKVTRRRANSAESKKPRKTQRKPVSFKRSASVRPKTRRGTVKSKGGGKKRRH